MIISPKEMGFELTQEEADALADDPLRRVESINPGKTIDCKLNFKQYQFATSRAKYPAMLGAKGASKTWGLIFRCLYLCVKTPFFGDMAGNRGFVARKEWQSFKMTAMREIFRIIPRQWIRTYIKSDRVIVLENGSELVLGHFDDLSPIMGINLGFAAFSQIEQMDADTWIEFQTNRVRMVHKLNGESLEYTSCFGEGNPPGPAHWTYLWFANDRKREDADGGYDDRYELIHSKTLDNKEFLPVDHFSNAKKNLSERRYRIDIEGSPEGIEGQCFDEYNPTVHDLRDEIVPKAHWKKGFAIDYGRTSGNACSFLALDQDTWPWKLYHFDEAYLPGGLVEDHVTLIVQKMQQQLAERRKRDGEAPSLADYAREFTHQLHDPAMMRLADNASSQSRNITVVGLYQEAFGALGVPVGLRPADNDVDAGLDRVNFLYRHNQMFINWRCRHTREQSISYIMDPKTAKPKNGQVDHQCDTKRYAVGAFYLMLVEPAKPKHETVVDRILRLAREEQQMGERDPYLGRLAWNRRRA